MSGLASWIGDEGSTKPEPTVVQWVDGAGWVYQLRVADDGITARLVRLQRGRIGRKTLGTYIVAPVAGGLSKLADDLRRWQDGTLEGVHPTHVIIDEVTR